MLVSLDPMAPGEVWNAAAARKLLAARVGRLENLWYENAPERDARLIAYRQNANGRFRPKMDIHCDLLEHTRADSSAADSQDGIHIVVKRNAPVQSETDIKSCRSSQPG